MKKIKVIHSQLHAIIFLLLAFGAVVPFISCNDNQDDSVTYPQNRNIQQDGGLSYSGCKDSGVINKSGKLEGSSEEKEVCFSLQTVDSNYLYIQHFDAVFNCVFDSLKIDYNLDKNVIHVKESHVNPNAYCTCVYDIKYKIGPLDYGTYRINIMDESSDLEDVYFNFEFTANTNYTLTR